MANTFGINNDELLRVASQLRPDIELDTAVELFARSSWTGLAEPGDGAAGLLIDSVGATAALQLLLEEPTASKLENAILESGAAYRAGLDTLLAQALDRWMPRLRGALSLKVVDEAAVLGLRLIMPSDDEWPSAIADLGHHAPLALWVKGGASQLAATKRSISVTGARACSGYGEHISKDLVEGLVDQGFAIISGGAYGIDGTAHRATMHHGGTTVAVLAGGLDRYYPSGHDQLLRRVAEEGVVLSELPPGAAPTKWRFLQRNRLIAALSQATVVTEAGRRSNALNTAGHALALDRPLGAVPGPITSPASAGCHRLLREYGATCVTTSEEAAELATSA